MKVKELEQRAAECYGNKEEFVHMLSQLKYRKHNNAYVADLEDGRLVLASGYSDKIEKLVEQLCERGQVVLWHLQKNVLDALNVY